MRSAAANWPVVRHPVELSMGGGGAGGKRGGLSGSISLLSSSDDEGADPPLPAHKRPRTQISLLDSSDDEGMPRPRPPHKRPGAQPNPPGAASLPAMKQAMEQLLGGSRGVLPPAQASATRRTTRPASTRPVAGEQQRQAPPPPADGGELWVEKHAPRSESDLVVHKKKVEEVRQWMEQQLAAAGTAAAAHGAGAPAAASKVLVVTGPPGCGKSAVVSVLAAAAGFEVAEWRAPAPTLWEEAQYQRAGGVQYQSKLDAFDEFVLRAKLPALSLSRPPPPPSAAAPAPGRAAVAAGRARSAATRPKLVLLDDLPHASDGEQRQRLAAALRDLASTARFPVVICLTEPSGRSQQEKGDLGAGGGAGPSALHKELAKVLEAAHAATVAFNPLTALTIAKALRAALAAERRAAPAELVAAIAEQADGDLHSALSTLQFVCTGAAAAPAAGKRKKGRGGVGGRQGKGAGADGSAGGAAAGGSMAALMRRDASLSLFHGLGKLLYNKRLPAALVAAPAAAHSRALAGRAAAPPREFAPWAVRAPMDNFDPEAVLAGAGLGAGSVAAFLHENLPAFVEDAEVCDLAGCLHNLSAADVLSSGSRYGGAEAQLVEDDLPGGTLADAAAASVAARGVCFYNAHPAPRRWQPLRAPALFAVQRVAAANRAEAVAAAGPGRVVHGGAGGLDSAARLASELLPYLRRIAPAAPGDAGLLLQQPAMWTRFWQGQLHEARLHHGAGGAADGAGGDVAEEDWIEDADAAGRGAS